MGKKKLDVMAKEREYFIYGQKDEEGKVVIPGCIRNGIDKDSANKIFDEMAEFAKYAFNKSHAAAYAVVAYRTAYLKTYYPPEFMAATLNSFLGNLDKVPAYIEECRRLGIEILYPSINKSYEKFAVYGNQIRFGLGSIKNVGLGAVEDIVNERKQNGEYKSFTDFCERILGKSVNRKCIESLIKAGAFDEFNLTRTTLLESYEKILDTIDGEGKKNIQGQVSIFDIGATDEKLEQNKYQYIEKPECTEKEFLNMEKEMLGVYISGHPLNKWREQIKKLSTIDTISMTTLTEKDDGKIFRIAGIINSIKKKYTKNNTLMAFITLEDLYGTCELIAFETCLAKSGNSVIEDNIVLVEGRLSIREDEAPTIIANKIEELSENMGNEIRKEDVKSKMLSLDITNASEVQKEKLRGAIKFFQGDRNNILVQVVDREDVKPCGAIYFNDEILQEFKEILGEQNVNKIIK